MKDNDKVDYKELLHKYIEHVGQEEGSDFINQVGYSKQFSNVKFTDDEVAVLNHLSSIEYKNK